MIVISRAPFRILRAHGVDPAEVALFERRFGPLFPGHIAGPKDAIDWLLALLPWANTAPILGRWLERALEKTPVWNDRRPVRTLQQVRAPVAEESAALHSELERVLLALLRARGADLILAPDGDHTEDIRVWATLMAAAAAAHAAACRRHGFSTQLETVRIAFSWVLPLVINPLEETASQTLDSMIRELVSAAAEFVGTWAPAADA